MRPGDELQDAKAPEDMKKNTKLITLGGGCFWCVESVYYNVKGVELIISGYANGNNKNPNYEDICTGQTNHAEVLQIYYNPAVVTYSKLLEVFWLAHDPTTLN